MVFTMRYDYGDVWHERHVNP